jgi:hypothetical protein
VLAGNNRQRGINVARGYVKHVSVIKIDSHPRDGMGRGGRSDEMNRRIGRGSRSRAGDGDSRKSESGKHTRHTKQARSILQQSMQGLRLPEVRNLRESSGASTLPPQENACSTFGARNIVRNDHPM